MSQAQWNGSRGVTWPTLASLIGILLTLALNIGMWVFGLGKLDASVVNLKESVARIEAQQQVFITRSEVEVMRQESLADRQRIHEDLTVLKRR